MCKAVEEMRNEAASKAAKEAKQEERKRIVNGLLSKGKTIPEIADMLDLPMAAIEMLITELREQ